MDLTLLHKKLLPNWSAGSVSKSISTAASLNAIQLSFDKLESKIKMRVLLSLLNFDNKTKAECIGPIKELIRLAADESKSGKVCTSSEDLVCPRCTYLVCVVPNTLNLSVCGPVDDPVLLL